MRHVAEPAPQARGLKHWVSQPSLRSKGRSYHLEGCGRSAPRTTAHNSDTDGGGASRGCPAFGEVDELPPATSRTRTPLVLADPRCCVSLGEPHTHWSSLDLRLQKVRLLSSFVASSRWLSRHTCVPVYSNSCTSLGSLPSGCERFQLQGYGLAVCLRARRHSALREVLELHQAAMASTPCACVNLTKFSRNAGDLPALREGGKRQSSAHGLCQVAIPFHIRTLDLSSRSLSKLSFLPLSVDVKRPQRLYLLRSSLKDNAPSVVLESSHEDSIKVAVQEAQEATELAQAAFQNLPPPSQEIPLTVPQLSSVARDRMLRRRNERKTYLVAAIASSVGFTFLAVAAVVYRFAWQANVSTRRCFRCVHAIFELAFLPDLQVHSLCNHVSLRLHGSC